MTEPPNDAAAGGSGVASTTNEESVANTVARELAAATGRDVLELDPIGETVDLEAVSSLVASGDGSLSVAFDHADHRVLVTGDGEVEVCHRSSTPEGR